MPIGAKWKSCDDSKRKMKSCGTSRCKMKIMPRQYGQNNNHVTTSRAKWKSCHTSRRKMKSMSCYDILETKAKLWNDARLKTTIISLQQAQNQNHVRTSGAKWSHVTIVGAKWKSCDDSRSNENQLMTILPK